MNLHTYVMLALGRLRPVILPAISALLVTAIVGLGLQPLPAAAADEAAAAKVLEPTAGDSKIARVVVYRMLQRHYTKPELNDEVSGQIFDEYFNRLDPEHVYFLKSDIDEFMPYRLVLDDLLRRGDLDFAFAVYRRFLERARERVDYAKARAEEPFDYTTDEELLVDRENVPWMESREALDEVWRKRMKNQMLVSVITNEEIEAARKVREAKQEGDAEAVAEAHADAELPVTGQDVVDKGKIEEKEESPQQQFVERHEEYLGLLQGNDNTDVLELYLSTFTQVFDPHSSYFNWRTSEDFDISMKLSLQGIGATLTMEDGYTKVVSVVPGGPAALDGRLKAGDHILGVGQEGGELEDVVNMPLNQVVRKIRGEKGTGVTLSIAKDVHDVPQIIKITRDEVQLRDQEAKSEVIEHTGPDGQSRKIGIIYLPSFYADFEALRTGDPNAKSTTVDVRNLVEKMTKEDAISGLVIDLRYNGGGSLTEAINLAGLFIPSGPIVQVREREGINVYPDADGGFAFDMPLAVLTNRTSASASEIFAAAIQDYGRGILIGDQMTHGKGTVQTVQKLDMLHSLREENPGALKFTMAKFYRVNGGSTQQRGVHPDFVLPSFLDHMVKGEAELEHAMAWDEIEAREIVRARPDVVSHLDFLRQRHDSRLAEDEQFKQLVSDIHRYGERRDRKTITLNKDERIKLRKEDEYWAKRSDEILSKTKRGKLNTEDEGDLDADFYLRETLNILSDLVSVVGVDSTVAKRIDPVLDAAGKGVE